MFPNTKTKRVLPLLLACILLISLAACNKGPDPDSVATPQLSPVVYSPGRTLGEIPLPAGWTWSNANTVPTVDASSYLANYSSDGLQFERNIPLEVQKAAPTAPNLPPVNYSPLKTLGGIALPSGWAWLAPQTALTASKKSYDASYTSSDGNYKSVSSVPVKLTVLPIDPAAPPMLTAHLDEQKTLEDVPLPEGWQWLSPDQKLSAEAKQYDAVFPAQENYNAREAKVWVEGVEPQGEVVISIIDDGERNDPHAKYPQPMGIIAGSFGLRVYSGETIAAFTLRAIAALELKCEYAGGTGKGENFYLSAIGGFYSAVYQDTIDWLGENDGGPMSGWVVLLNGWEIDNSASEFTLSADDEIVWRFTCYSWDGF